MMKRFNLFCLILILFGLTSHGQWQSQNNMDYYFTGRFLSVGNSFADADFSVVNDSSFISSTQATLISSFRREYQNSTARFDIYGYPNTGSLSDYMRNSVMLYSSVDAKNFKICAAPRGASIQFLTNGWISDTSERMRIDSIGYVGISTTAPKARLHIADGDIYISDINKGVIMKSPDGQCWRGTMSNEGALEFVMVDCPESIQLEETELSKPTLNLSFYPNPVQNYLSIRLEGTSGNEVSHFEILACDGKLVVRKRLADQFARINTSDLSPGIYFVNILGNSGNILCSEKFIKSE